MSEYFVVPFARSASETEGKKKKNRKSNKNEVNPDRNSMPASPEVAEFRFFSPPIFYTLRDNGRRIRSDNTRR